MHLLGTFITSSFAPISELYRAFCRYRAPVGVAELMHFFDITHPSINVSASSSAASCSNQRQRIKTEDETQQHGIVMLNQEPAEVTYCIALSCSFDRDAV